VVAEEGQIEGKNLMKQDEPILGPQTPSGRIVNRGHLKEAKNYGQKLGGKWKIETWNSHENVRQR